MLARDVEDDLVRQPFYLNGYVGVPLLRLDLAAVLKDQLGAGAPVLRLQRGSWDGVGLYTER